MRIVAVWLAAAAGWATFVALTSIGPVVADLGWYHGVHTSDLVVGAAAGAVAAVVTRAHVTGLGGGPGRHRPTSVADRAREPVDGRGNGSPDR